MLLESAASWTAIHFLQSCQRTSSSPLDISQGPKSLLELWTLRDMATSYRSDVPPITLHSLRSSQMAFGCFVNPPRTLTSQAGSPAVPRTPTWLTPSFPQSCSINVSPFLTTLSESTSQLSLGHSSATVSLHFPASLPVLYHIPISHFLSDWNNLHEGKEFIIGCSLLFVQ